MVTPRPLSHCLSVLLKPQSQETWLERLRKGSKNPPSAVAPVLLGSGLSCADGAAANSSPPHFLPSTRHKRPGTNSHRAESPLTGHQVPGDSHASLGKQQRHELQHCWFYKVSKMETALELNQFTPIFSPRLWAQSSYTWFHRTL